jgi:fatty-acyl-CoA synthase
MHDRAKRVSNALLGPGHPAGRPGRDPGLEHRPAHGSLVRHHGHRRGLPHPQSAPASDQIAWIIRHAEDRIIFVDLTFVPILETILANCPSVEHVIVFTDSHHMTPFQIRGVPSINWKGAHTYETLVEGSQPTSPGAASTKTPPAASATPRARRATPRACSTRTAPTTSTPWSGCSATCSAFRRWTPSCRWCRCSTPTPGASPSPRRPSGAKLVMPGSKMDGESIHELLETEGVTFSAAVPTVWQMLLQHLDKNHGKLSTLKRVVIGGSACPEAIIRGFHDRYGVDVCTPGA